MKIKLLFDIKAWLGEGPMWHAKMQTLYWLDILNKRMYADSDVLFELDDIVGCISPRIHGGLILTKRFSFWTFEPDSATSIFLAALTNEPTLKQYPLSDGVFPVETNVEGSPLFEFAG